ncbi:MAG: chemotaxis protein CheX [Spirochaetes bacterium]|nr:chemotaxis protein CheX [Spirochaetota bacterium]
MKEGYNNIIIRVVDEIFEDFAFMFQESLLKEDIPEIDENCIKTSIGFEGPVIGTVSLVVPETMCKVLAANLLGFDQEEILVPAKGIDALKEVLNIICSNIITSLYNEDLVFEYSVPKAVRIDKEEWLKIVEKPEVLTFMMDDFPVLVEFIESDI